jgi:hypothetical protein
MRVMMNGRTLVVFLSEDDLDDLQRENQSLVDGELKLAICKECSDTEEQPHPGAFIKAVREKCPLTLDEVDARIRAQVHYADHDYVSTGIGECAACGGSRKAHLHPGTISGDFNAR